MRTHLKTFLLYCNFFHINPFPITTWDLEAYIVFLSQSFKSVVSIKTYVITVRFHHFLQGYSFPNISSQQFGLLFKGITKVLLHTPRRARPLSPPLLLKIFQSMDLSKLLNITLWTSYLVTFFTFQRKSSIIPRTHASFDPQKHLLRRDITVIPEGLLVSIKYSKVVQAQQHITLIPISAFQGSPLCPRAAFLLMTHLIPASPDAPAFLFPSPQGLRSIGYDQFVDGLRTHLELAGVPSEGFQGHSLRRGSATWAFSLGVPADLIQQQGGWRSDAYKIYLELSWETRMSVTSSFTQSILSLKS